MSTPAAAYRRYWPWVRLYGWILLTFSIAVAPFVVAFALGAPWWICYFAIIPLCIVGAYGSDYARKRRWMA